ncbi:hypothetical protein MDA_GLEAN10000212 [Myotis davidii]|uniref:Uncharacterized protein n=1 Tax=Myotis davidii TaxID=225400 RepID=L5M6Z8_MYODS|nr:hypothetical protein MDA_GLEAN10000212 [Myotis davidii]
MAGIGHRGIVEQVNGGARPTRGFSCCHQGKALVVAESSLLPHTAVPPSAHTCCWSLHRFPPLLPLGPTDGASPACTHSWCQSCRSHLLQHPAPIPLLGTISRCEWRLPALITPEGFSTSPCSRGAIGAAAAAHTCPFTH